MIEDYLEEDELYSILTKTPKLSKKVALNFIRSYGTDRVIAAFEEIRKKQGETITQGFMEAEIEAHFESANEKLNELLHALAGVFSEESWRSRCGKVLS